MLPGSRQDAEDALQDVFVRAYSGLRANDRELALRAWLYRVAHNRCVDELRRPPPPAPEVLELLRAPVHDPTVEAEQRESLRRLIDGRPAAARPAALGAADARARRDDATPSSPARSASRSRPSSRCSCGRGSASPQAAEARDTACSEIREELSVAHDRGVRPNAHSRGGTCATAPAAESSAREMRGVSRAVRGAGAGARADRACSRTCSGLGGGAGGGAAGAEQCRRRGCGRRGRRCGRRGRRRRRARVGASSRVGHVATLLAAAVVTAGGAVELQHTIARRPQATTRRRRFDASMIAAQARRRSPRGAGDDRPGAAVGGERRAGRARRRPKSASQTTSGRRTHGSTRRNRRRTPAPPAITDQLVGRRRGAIATRRASANATLLERRFDAATSTSTTPTTGDSRPGSTFRRNRTPAAARRARRRRRHRRPDRPRPAPRLEHDGDDDSTNNGTGTGTSGEHHRHQRHDELDAAPSGVDRRHRRPSGSDSGSGDHDAGRRSVVHRLEVEPVDRRPRGPVRSRDRPLPRRSSTTRRCSSAAGAGRGCSRSSRSTRRSAARRSAAAGCGRTTTRARRCATRCGCRGR